MSYNQKPSGSGNSGGVGGSTPNGPNNQTPQQVAKTLAGIQQQMQSLVHGQNALPQAQAQADLNAFFQQQRFQNMFKQQQHQLLQQHFQQQIQQQQQQQNKDRVGGGEPLALTRTPAAAELLNKTYQQHHQQQANGSSAAGNSALSVNQQFQQQLQAFPPNIVQQLQALQVLQQQQQQQQQPQHPPQQHHTQQLQQAHQPQQHQGGQHQTQHQTPQQQLHAGQLYQQQQQQKALSNAAAAHMQQLQQSLQQKYLSAAAAANQPAITGNKLSATPPPPPLTNQIKPPNLPSSTQITPVSVTSTVTAPTSSGTSKSSTTTAPALPISAASGVAKSVSTPSQSSSLHSTVKQSAISPTANVAHQHTNKLGGNTAVSNKTPPIVSAIPPPFPTHYQKPSSGISAAQASVASVVGGSGVSAAPAVTTNTSSTVKTTPNPETVASKTPQTPIASLINKQTAAITSTTVTKPTAAAATTSTAAKNVTSNINPVTTQKSKPLPPLVSSIPQQAPVTAPKNVAASESGKSSTASKPSDNSLIKESKTVAAPVATTTENAAGQNSSATPVKESTESVTKDVKPSEIVVANKEILHQANTSETSKIAEPKETPTVSDKVAEVTPETKTTDRKTTLEEVKEDVSTKNDTSAKVDNILTQTSVEKKDAVAAVDLKKDKPEKSNNKPPPVQDEKSEITAISAEKSKKLTADVKSTDITEKCLVKVDSISIEDKLCETSEGDTTVKSTKSSISAASAEKIENKNVTPKDLPLKDENQKEAVESLKDTLPEKPKEKNENIKSVDVAEESIETKITNTKPESIDVKQTTKDVSSKTKVNDNIAITETPVKKVVRQPKLNKTVSVDKTDGPSKRNSREERRSTAKQQKIAKTGDASPTTPTLSTKSSSSDRKSQRHRLKTILYQSPLPELAYITKLSASEASNSPKPMSVEDKLIVFYKNEYMAVRNAEGTFYLCQTMQNVYRTSPRISIRWLSEDKKDCSVYIPDFYDHTDIECVLTTVELKRVDKGHLRLPKAEKTRIESILKKAIDVEKGLVPRPDITEENPDGLDISLYKDESQIEKKTSGRSSPSTSGRKSRRSSNVGKSSLAPLTERKRKSSSIGSKSPTKKRKSLTKKKKISKNNSTDEESSDDEEESDTDYKPNQKKATNLSSKLSPRAQRSPLARARAASPITPSSSKTNTEVPETSTSTPISNSRLNRGNKRKSTSDLEATNSSTLTTSTKMISTKPTTNKSKAHGVEAKLKKSNESTVTNVASSSPSTSSVNSGNSRSTRNRK